MDGHTGDNDDKLAPAVVLVQLEHGLDVNVGLAHAGLHLKGEVIAICPPLQFIRRLDLIGALNLIQLLQYPLVGQTGGAGKWL